MDFMVLTQDYFLNRATELAPDLVGKLLCRQVDGEILRLRILETECYFGQEDTACHAHKGRTPRTDVMYLEGGRAYIYLCYGMHNLLNLTTGAEGHPEAVLIRGLEGVCGPGRLTKRMSIDRSLNTCLLCPENQLWVEDDGVRLPFLATPRVGIGYASEEDQARPWRFVAETEKEKKYR